MKRDPLRRELTDALIRKLPSPPKKLIYWDTKQAGLGLLVTPTGVKSFKAVYRHAGRLRWYTIDRYPAIGLKEARTIARKVRAAAAEGKDPQGEKIEARRGETFRDLQQRYFDLYASKRNKSWRQPSNLIRWHVLPEIGSRKAVEITRADVRTLFKRLSADRPVLANQVLAAISAVYAWAIKEEEIELPANPASGIERNRVASKERTLSDAELPLVWPAFDGAGSIRGAALKAILLTGQRPGEVRHMRWEHIDGHWWTMPGDPDEAAGWPGTKNHRTHRIYLPEAMLDLLQRLGPKKRGYVFPGRTGGPVTNLDKAAQDIVASLKLPKFTPHDLRRTHGSTITGLGFGREAMNRIQNHIEGGIADVYDRHGYAVENQRIMEAVAAHILALGEGRPAPSNVVPLPAAG